MQLTTKLIIIAIAVSSMALAPSLIPFNSAEAAKHCSAYKGKSGNWIGGCKEGWYDRDHCWGYDPGDGHYKDYYSGYNFGWKKGICK